jgi:hypothetical protein
VPYDAATVYQSLETNCLHRQHISLARARLASTDDKIDFMAIDAYGNMSKEQCYFISKMLQDVQHLNKATDVIDTFRAVHQICVDTGGSGKEYQKRMHARKSPYFFPFILPCLFF